MTHAQLVGRLTGQFIPIDASGTGIRLRRMDSIWFPYAWNSLCHLFQLDGFLRIRNGPLLHTLRQLDIERTRSFVLSKGLRETTRFNVIQGDWNNQAHHWSSALPGPLVQVKVCA